MNNFRYSHTNVIDEIIELSRALKSGELDMFKMQELTNKYGSEESKHVLEQALACDEVLMLKR